MIETVRTKCIIFGEALKVRGQKYEQTLPENSSKSAKMAFAVCQFSNIFRESMPPDPLESCLVLKLLKINSADKKLRLKK